MRADFGRQDRDDLESGDVWHSYDNRLWEVGDYCMDNMEEMGEDSLDCWTQASPEWKPNVTRKCKWSDALLKCKCSSNVRVI